MEATVAESWEKPKGANIHWFVHLLPSLTDFAFLLPAFLLFFILPGSRVLFSDGDTGWQIRTGDWILAHGAVPKTDIFSFTKPHDAWFAWEWGADVALATAHRIAGLPGVAWATVLLLGCIAALLFRLVRRVSGDDLLAFGFTLLAICGSIGHWLARPHLLSWLFLLVFAHALLSAERGNRRPLCWLPLAMLLWTNLHGGFFIGLALLLASAAGALIQVLVGGGATRSAAYRATRPYIACTLACFAVTFVNPYGWHLHQHIAHYLLDSKLLDNIQEYQSFNFRQPGASFFECMLLVGLAAAYSSARRGEYSSTLTILLWAHLALVSVRNMAIFILLAAPAMAATTREAVEWLRNLPCFARRRRALWSDVARELQPLERVERWHLASGLGLALLALAFAAGQPGFEGRFSPRTFPVAALPALDAAHAKRLFTSDQWADYLLYRFFPRQRVFMDDRSDFYGYAFLAKYQHIMGAQHDWQRNLREYSVDTVLVEPDSALASVLKEASGWRILADGGSYILFQRDIEPNDSRGRENEGAAQRNSGHLARPPARDNLVDIARPTILVPLPKTTERRIL